VVPEQELAVSVLTNASDGVPHLWLEGALHILLTYRREGGASRSTARWNGRWWSLWGAFDLLPMADKVLVANPALANPLMDASEIKPGRSSRDGTGHGRISLAGGYASPGDPVRILRNGKGEATASWLGGSQLVTESQAAREVSRRYEKPRAATRRKPA